jgi:hypothetical protein
MTRCYDYKNVGTTKDGAIVTEDTSIEVGNITKEDKLYTYLFWLMN